VNTPAFSSASDRNKQPIAEQLTRLLPGQTRVLEIGSGWGQHAVFFCRTIPHLSWQPSERAEVLGELEERLDAQGFSAIKPAIPLNVLSEDWQVDQFDTVYSANTSHIMSWTAVCAMFAGVGKHLLNDGLFILYGPFNIGGRFTAPSNQAFDQSLRARDADMGIRDLESLETLAGNHQMRLSERISMPANNFLLVFVKCRKPGIR